MSKVLLLSSGLDSLVAWYFLGKPNCLHVMGHSRYSWKELECILKFKDKHPETEVSIVGANWLSQFEEPDANIPARNLFFIDVASHFADEIYLVCQLGEMSIPDRNDKFFSDISKMLTFLYQKKKVVSPVFGNLTKMDMVKWALENGVPKEELLGAYSCFSGTGTRCGRCAACFRAAVALDYCSILPNNFFDENIWEAPIISEYIRRLKDGKYEQRRAEQTIQVLIKCGLWR